ncbi:MAG: hypothetical protein K2K49_05950 [Duncaniella sp.]|nr:hypothetical protein [Duncaniella sp.]
MNRTKYLVVKGLAGLGNRLITLLAAADYARATGRSLHVDWSDGMFGPVGENVFYKYFALDGVTSEENLAAVAKRLAEGASSYPATLTPEALMANIYATYDCVSSPLGRNPLYRVPLSLVTRGTASAFFGLQTWQPLPDTHDGWRKSLANVRNGRGFVIGSVLPRNIDSEIVIYADFRPWVKSERIFDIVRLREPLLKEFKEFAAKHDLGDKGIGVHVRATDKTTSKSRDKLHRHITEWLGESDKRKVFLSSDNPEVVAEFEAAYPGRVVQYPKFMPDDPSGHGLHHWALQQCDNGEIKEKMFREALADMWVLSMCDRLLWQGNSSFSLMSAHLKKDKKNVKDWLKL